MPFTKKELMAMLDAQSEREKTMTLQKDDVWGRFDSDHKKISDGMIVARRDDICPVFGDKVPYKSVTVVCKSEEVNEVLYWLSYVHGGDNINGMKEVGKGKVAIRSDYMCW